jgi:hypothetical protein
VISGPRLHLKPFVEAGGIEGEMADVCHGMRRSILCS